MTKNLYRWCSCLILIFCSSMTQAIPIPGYMSFPDTIDPFRFGSNQASHHTGGGPVLADDFLSSFEGDLYKVTWWGSLAASNEWELTFHSRNNLDPTLPGNIATQHYVTATGTEYLPSLGLYEYTALWNPKDLWIDDWEFNWFSVANYADDWLWATGTGANPFSPGGDLFSVRRSTGGGSPHFGPWMRIMDKGDVATNMAFIITVPEPSSIALFGVGLIGLGILRRRRLHT